MNRLARIWWTGKGVGWDNVPRRLLQAWRVRTGVLRRRLDAARFSQEAFQRSCSAGVAQQRALWRQRRERFLSIPSRESLCATCDDDTFGRTVLAVCEKALAGEYLFFSHWYGHLGWPPDFNLDPAHGIHWPVGPHWTGTARSGPPRDDIKLVWEPSRFSLAYYFARAYARSGENRWAEAFWTMLEGWVSQNPAQQSVAWGCGQEMTFRLMAMLFGAIVTLESPAATDERLASLSRLAWQTGKHISININYARSQKNNHAISEAAGLWTVGTLFPELPEAAKWQQDGGHVLAAEVRRQIYDDGSFVQHSMNYHRVMLDDLLWALAISRQAAAPLPTVVQARFSRATRWLEQMIDSVSGRVPNYGPNDGALVLPLDCCDYLDYRPTAQAARVLVDGQRSFEPGPWDEKMLWLASESALKAKTREIARPATVRLDEGGYYILRGRESWGMIRCHTYLDRPAQADMLHFDLWAKGENILRDAGSYSYCCQEPWKHYFIFTASHNTIELDGQDQMVKGPRFMWFRWIRAKLLDLQTSSDGQSHHLESEHYGYRRLPGSPVHHRSIDRHGDTWVITDDLSGQGEHDIALRWRLCPADWKYIDGLWHATVAGTDLAIAIQAPWKCRLVSGQESPPEGWESLYYGRKVPAPTIICQGRSSLPVRLTTWIGPRECWRGEASAPQANTSWSDRMCAAGSTDPTP